MPTWREDNEAASVFRMVRYVGRRILEQGEPYPLLVSRADAGYCLELREKAVTRETLRAREARLLKKYNSFKRAWSDMGRQERADLIEVAEELEAVRAELGRMEP